MSKKEKTTEKVVGGTAEGAAGASVGIVKGLAGIASRAGRALPRGIRHPDTLIQRPELYTPIANEMSPIGRKVTRWQDIYWPHGLKPMGSVRRLRSLPSKGSTGTPNKISVLPGRKPRLLPSRAYSSPSATIKRVEKRVRRSRKSRR